jgi:hypothetical protein
MISRTGAISPSSGMTDCGENVPTVPQDVAAPRSSTWWPDLLFRQAYLRLLTPPRHASRHDPNKIGGSVDQLRRLLTPVHPTESLVRLIWERNETRAKQCPAACTVTFSAHLRRRPVMFNALELTTLLPTVYSATSNFHLASTRPSNMDSTPANGSISIDQGRCGVF